MCGGLSFGIRLRLTECNCPGCLCTPLIELNQTNWTPKLLSIESDVAVSVFITFPDKLKRKPLGLLHTRYYNPEAGPHCEYQYYGFCHWSCVAIDGSSLTPQRAQHKTALSSWLKGLVSPNLLHSLALWIKLLNPNRLYSGRTFCFLIPVTGFGQTKKNHCTERFTFPSSHFFTPIIQGRKPASTSQCSINGCA